LLEGGSGSFAMTLPQGRGLAEVELRGSNPLAQDNTPLRIRRNGLKLSGLQVKPPMSCAADGDPRRDGFLTASLQTTARRCLAIAAIAFRSVYLF